MGQAVPDDDLPGTANVVPDEDLPDSQSPTESPPQLKQAPPWLVQSDKPIESGGPIGMLVGAANQYAGGKLASVAQKVGVTDPKSLQMIRNFPAAAEIVSPLFWGGNEAVAAEAHPLQPVADAERAEMQVHAKALENGAGIKLPSRELSPPQQWANNQATTDLKLPPGAPVTDAMIDAGKNQYASPAYEAVKSVQDYQLGPKYEDAIKGVDLSKIDPEWRPPTDGTMDGSRALELSSQLRSVARGLYEDADNMNLTYAQRTLARQTAQVHYQAAKAVETGFREGSGETGIADNWDNARIYTAKAEAWRGAIDQAGNVSGPKIKRLLGDEPITGPMKSVASAVAQYPEMFRSTRLQTPAQPGIIRSSIAKAAPVVGAVVGAASPLGPLWGTAAGASLGERFSNRLLKNP